MVYEKRYPNGLRLVVKRMEGLLSVTMGILVGTGSSVETDKEDGISHFIEHMQFKGTKKRTSFEISDAFDRIGAQVNAFTGKDVTCYYSKCTSDHTAEAFEILSDLFLNSTFPDEEMVREKGVVCEEISMNEDTPDDLCFDLLSSAYYGNSGYGRNILGPAANVKAFTREDIFRYKQERYCPGNIVVSFAGGIDLRTAETLVETYFDMPAAETFRPREKEISLKHLSLLRTKPIEQVHIAIGYPSLPREHRLADALQTVNSVLGGSMSSRLFQEVREKLGLAYSVYSYVSAFQECGSLVIYAGVNPASADKAYEEIGKVVAGMRENGITRDEFLRGREQMKSSMLFSQESTPSQMLLYGKYMLFNDQIFDFEGKLDAINAVSEEDVREAIALTFDESQKAVGAVGNTDKPFAL